MSPLRNIFCRRVASRFIEDVAASTWPKRRRLRRSKRHTLGDAVSLCRWACACSRASSQHVTKLLCLPSVLHSSALMFPSTSALSASSAAISSMISCGLRCVDFLAAVRVLHGEVEGRLVDALGVHAPGLGRVGEGLLQFHELGEVVVVERVGLAEVAAGVELVDTRSCASARLSRRTAPRSSRPRPGTCRRGSRARCAGCSFPAAACAGSPRRCRCWTGRCS